VLQNVGAVIQNNGTIYNCGNGMYGCSVKLSLKSEKCHPV
jgi:hypothetical protein